MDLMRIFQYALEREEEGLRFFEGNANRLQNMQAANAFRKIADEERRHIEFIKDQLKNIGEGGEGLAGEMTVPNILNDRTFQESIEQTIAESMVADLPVLRMAYLIERDFAEFYAMSAKNAQGEAKKALDLLAKWESGHEKLFKRLHDEAFEKYTNLPWGG